MGDMKSNCQKVRNALSFLPTLKPGLNIPDLKTFDENCNPFGKGRETLALFSYCCPDTIFFNISILNGSRRTRLSFEAATFHELGHYQHFRDNPREHVNQILNGNPACEVIANRFAEKALRLYEKTKAGKGLNINMDMNILETVSGSKGYMPNRLEI